MRRALKWRWMVRAAPLRMRLPRHAATKAARERSRPAERCCSFTSSPFMVLQALLHRPATRPHTTISNMPSPSVMLYSDKARGASPLTCHCHFKAWAIIIQVRGSVDPDLPPLSRGTDFDRELGYTHLQVICLRPGSVQAGDQPGVFLAQALSAGGER